MPSPPDDPIPPSLSALRRRLLSAGPGHEKAPALANDDKSESIDFDSVDGEGLLQALGPSEPPATSPAGYDEMEAMLARYQAENGIARDEPKSQPSANGSRRSSASDKRQLSTSASSEGRRQNNARPTLPPLTNQPRSELERLKTEVTELRQLNSE